MEDNGKGAAFSVGKIAKASPQRVDGVMKKQARACGNADRAAWMRASLRVQGSPFVPLQALFLE